MEAVGMIVNVVQKIVKAAETARQNRKRCLDLADRARTVGDILREDGDSTTSRIAGGGGVRKPPLERLKAALDDALELVESQRRFGLGIPKLITSGRTAAQFQDVETRITACVMDLGLAEQIAARRRDHCTNAEAAPVQEPPPPQQQQQGKAGPSLPQGYLPQSAPPTTASLYNQYLEQQGKHAESLMQAYQAQSAQEAKDAQSLMQGYLAQEAKDAQALMQCYQAQAAQEAKDAQALMQCYQAQSAEDAKNAQALMQCYLAQSAQEAKDAQSFYLAQSAQERKNAQALMQGYLAQSTPPPESFYNQYLEQQRSLLQGYLTQAAPPRQQGTDAMALLQGYGYFAM